MNNNNNCFQLSPLIRGTLITVYLALVLPLPALAPESLRLWLLAAVPLGLLAVLAMLSEQVTITNSGITVGHPPWCSWLLRRGWSLNWSEMKAIVPVGTSQGGKVFYITTHDQSQRLLPQRLEHFDRFLDLIQARSTLRTKGVGRLTPPWTYQLLAVLAALMLLGEGSVAFAVQRGLILIP
jgi:hypothetical protein